MQQEKQAVYGIVFNQKRTEILLVKRRDVPVWVLPGGGLDFNELPEEGAIREVKEETGYDVVAIRKVAEYLPVNKMTQLSHLYECQIVSGKPTHGSETQGVQFFHLDHLPPLPPPFKGWIEDGVSNQKTILRKKIEGVSYFILFKLFLQHPILVSRYLLTKMGIHFND